MSRKSVSWFQSNGFFYDGSSALEPHHIHHAMAAACSGNHQWSMTVVVGYIQRLPQIRGIDTAHTRAAADDCAGQWAGYHRVQVPAKRRNISTGLGFSRMGASVLGFRAIIRAEKISMADKRFAAFSRHGVGQFGQPVVMDRNFFKPKASFDQVN